MPIHAIGFHLIAVSILHVVLANGNLLRNVSMQKGTVLANPAVILQPVHTHLLLPLVLVLNRVK